MDNIELNGLRVRHCREDDLDAILTLESTVLSSLERSELLRRNTEDMWHTCLCPPHVCLGAWDGEFLAALAVLYVPQNNDGESLAPLLQTINIEGHRVAHFKICLVHPTWQGHHIQVFMGELLHSEARQQGFDLLCATASPYNTASIKNLHRLGYQADHQLQKYDSERIIFYCFN